MKKKLQQNDRLISWLLVFKSLMISSCPSLFNFMFSYSFISAISMRFTGGYDEINFGPCFWFNRDRKLFTNFWSPILMWFLKYFCMNLMWMPVLCCYDESWMNSHVRLQRCFPSRKFLWEHIHAPEHSIR